MCKNVYQLGKCNIKENNKISAFFDEKDDASDFRKGIAYVHFFENRHSDPSYLIKAILLLNKGLERLPNHVEGNYNLARAYQLQGENTKPIVLYKKVTKLDPSHMWSLYQLGRLYLYDDTKQSKEGRQCCAGQDIIDAKRVSETLGIEHKILYYQKKFKNVSKYVPEGVEGMVRFRGSVNKIIYNLVNLKIIIF